MRHHRDFLAHAVDTVGFESLDKLNIPRPGNVMVPVLHIQGPLR